MPHIPKGTTDTVALELFAPALEAALRPSPDYDVNRWLYVPNTYSEYRYILGTRGMRPLICVGINPLHCGAGCPGPHPAICPAHRPKQRL